MKNIFKKKVIQDNVKPVDVLKEFLLSVNSNFHPETVRMLLSVVELEDRVVREIMVPRLDIISIDKGHTLKLAIKKIRESGHSRLPITENDSESIIGILYAKDFIGVSAKKTIVEMARKPFFVPETKPVLDLLCDFRDKKVHIAIVVDEYGGVSGLVSMENIFEIIVGDIQDEHDNESDAIRKVTGGYKIDARSPVKDINLKCKTSFPEDIADSIGGVFLEVFGSVPTKGDKITIGKSVLSVEKMKDNAIILLMLK